MSEIIAKFIEALGSPLWLIGMFALAAGALAHHFAAADLEDSGGRAKLREALEAGGELRRLYIRLLTPALDRLDRIFGDADKASFSLPSPFGNREAHPYWTAWSFDRCALLALAYPLLSLFVVWVWTGESGPIAQWLGMKHGAAWRERLVAAAAIIIISFMLWRSMRLSGWRSYVWLATVAVICAAFFGLHDINKVFFFTFIGTAVVAIGIAIIFIFTFATAFIISGNVSGAALVAYAVNITIYNPGYFIGFLVGVGAVSVVIAVKYCERHNALGWFWVGYWPLVLAASYIGLISGLWQGAAASLRIDLMFALIPIVNIPFDWASLGLTRALLRRGAEDGAPSPLWLGLLDFFLGLILLALLAVALIAALQGADAIILHFHRDPVANVVALLDNIAENPRDPANYWAYATLFSTLIPSALNAVIGAVSLIGWWLPRVREWVLTQLHALDRENTKGIRARVSAVFAIQAGAGTALTCFVLWGLWEALLEFPYVFPSVIGLLRRFALVLA
jgi:hypothetical protein